MAHAIFVAEIERRNLQMETHSAGVCDFTDLPPVYDTIATCLKFNTPPPKEESTWVRDLPLASIDRFLVMEQYHAHALVEEFGVSPERINLLADFDPEDRGREIDDPIGRGSAVYEKCYRQIRDCLVNYLDSMIAPQ